MAAETLQSFVSEIKRHKYCLLPNLSEDGWLIVVCCFGSFIRLYSIYMLNLMRLYL